jgi:hypothetical protein
MNTTSADVLEFEALRGLLGRYVSSPLGKAELAKIVPHTDAARLGADLAGKINPTLLLAFDSAGT